MHVLRSALFAGLISALLASAAYGQWMQNGPYGVDIRTFAGNDSDLFAGTDNGGVFHSTDQGSHWTPLNDGLPANATPLAFAVSGPDLIAGTYGHGGWKRLLSPLVAAPIPAAGGASRIQLYQNVPNPLEAATTIRFALAVATHIRLSIFDVAGREVVCLIDGERAAGNHHVSWQPKEVASGVYFYRLETRDTAETRRLTVLK